MVGRLATELLR